MKCGYIALFGRSNVGKSTLLNGILGQKLAITCRKPQATRHQLRGIKTIGDLQYIFIDTPGLHKQAPKHLNKNMNKVSQTAITDADCIAFMIEYGMITKDDEWCLDILKQEDIPAILVINKIDKEDNPLKIEAFRNTLLEKYPFVSSIGISARKPSHCTKLEALLASCLPSRPHLFPAEQLTTATDQYVAAELIRESLIRRLYHELPYACYVQIEHWGPRKGAKQPTLHIAAIIWVESASQKSMVIGKHGATLKAIGTTARINLEKFFDQKIYLQTWVKIKSDWSDDPSAIG